MIIVKFQGGIGNQMFQYALYRFLKNIYPKSVVKADLSSFEIYQYHSGYELNRVFGIEVDQATRREVRQSSNYIPIAIKKGVINVFLDKALKKFMRIKEMVHGKNDRHIIEKDISSYGDVLDLDDESNWYIDGAWGGFFYCMDISLENISADFQFKNTGKVQETANLLNKQNFVGIHVRRGDYVNSVYDVITIEYYKRAMRYLERKLKNFRYIFFSDSTAYVEKSFSFVSNKIIIENTGGGCIFRYVFNEPV